MLLRDLSAEESVINNDQHISVLQCVLVFLVTGCKNPWASLKSPSLWTLCFLLPFSMQKNKGRSCCEMLNHKIISGLNVLWKSNCSQLLCPKSAAVRSWKKKSYFILQSIGCDDYLGSDKVIDKCGICGGDNTACKVVSGVFKHTLTNLGYHKIVEIPEGATKINITEMSKSNNYLGKLHLSE